MVQGAGPDGAALDRAADEAFWDGEHDRSLDLRREAYRAHVAEGDHRGAALSAWRLFYDHWLIGERAPATGWLERCRRHVADAGDPVAEGWLEIADADVATGPEPALAAAQRARAIGTAAGDPDLTAMALQAEGRALVAAGDRLLGLSRLDEAMVAVVNDELQPLYVGWVYCNVVATCHALADLRRASQWSAAAMRWCAALRSDTLYPGLCRVYAVELAYLHGDWDRALADAERACADLTAFEPRYAGPAFGLVGDLRRLQGDLAGAEAAYRRAHELGTTPQPGLALLDDARGERAAAVRALSTAADHADGDGPLPDALLLVTLADLACEAGETDVALDAWHRLIGMADGHGGVLDAFAAAARGELAAHHGEPHALTYLHEAVVLLARLDLPYETACRRRRLAALADAAGDGSTARVERTAAATAFAALGATLDLARLEGTTSPGPGEGTCPLSEREREVLALVAAGRTDDDIAATLVLSPHTVARHVANIRTKLAVHSRAAAVAEATARGWLAAP